MKLEDHYSRVVLAECIETFDESVIEVGKTYKLGVKHNNLLNKEAYYILHKTNAFGMPVYVEIESGYFKEALNSMSFILLD